MRHIFHSLRFSFLISVIIVLSAATVQNSNGDEELNVKHAFSNKQNHFTKKYIRYTLKEAVAKDFVQVEGASLGTFKKIQVIIKNKSSQNISLIVPAGIYFTSPDVYSQCLITAKKIPEIQLKPNQETIQTVPSFCTNSARSTPGQSRGWPFNSEYDGGLDEAILFYGDYETEIGTWLKMKNPSKFSTEEDRLLFFQVAVWYHEGGNYSQILDLLSKDVFANDTSQAKKWLDEVDQDAKEFSFLMKAKDDKKVTEWIKSEMTKLFNRF